jgi:hypothetical protein
LHDRFHFTVGEPIKRIRPAGVPGVDGTPEQTV